MFHLTCFPINLRNDFSLLLLSGLWPVMACDCCCGYHSKGKNFEKSTLMPKTKLFMFIPMWILLLNP